VGNYGEIFERNVGRASALNRIVPKTGNGPTVA